MQTHTHFGSPAKRLSPARCRFWKHRVPAALKAALDECLSFALEAHNRSVDRVAELVGLDSKWVLYKWIGETRMPINMVAPFEHACGIDLVSRFMAANTGKLVIPLACGRASTPGDINHLQCDTTEAIRALLEFYAGRESAEVTQAAILTAMQDLGWHHANVGKHEQPEFDFQEQAQ